MNGLIIFVKNPVLGRVKTRLAASIGHDKALTIYHRLLEHTRKVALKVDAIRFLFYSDGINEEDEWSPLIFNKQLQKGNDLGNRISNAFKAASKECDKMVIIGSDCPDIDSGIIKKSYSLLENYDCIIGPANDGGYYLYGLRKYDPDLFKGIEWSTSNVLNQSIRILEQKGLKYNLLPEKIDIDTEEDLIATGWKI